MIKKNTVLLFMAAMGVVLTSYAFFFSNTNPDGANGAANDNATGTNLPTL